MTATNAFGPGLQVSSRACIRKRRELPLKGQLLVKEGDTVSGTQVVAQAQLEGELRIVRIAESLGVAAEEVAGLSKVAVGSSVAEGDVLAEVRGLWGLFKSTVCAPISGIVEFLSASTGHIGIRAAPRVLDVQAYIPGRIVALEPDKAVTIEATVTFVQGIFGVGGERLGQLKVLPISVDTRLDTAHIPADCSQAVIVGGHSPTIGAIKAAVARGAVGLVTGSIDDPTLRAYIGYDLGIALTGDEAIPMTLIVTEGFGEIPMSSRVLNALQPVDGKNVSINGTTQVRAGAQRPEIVVWEPSNRSTEDAGAVRGLAVGARVRLIRVPFFGLQGVVEELPRELMQLETGAFARVLKARLDDGRVVQVPRANIELL
jgi:hypothetical protein